VGGAAQPIQSAVVASLTGSQERTFYFSIFTFCSGIFAAAGTLAARLVSVHDAFLLATVVGAVGLATLVPLEVPEFQGRMRSLKSARVIGKFSLTGYLFSEADFALPFLLYALIMAGNLFL